MGNSLTKSQNPNPYVKVNSKAKASCISLLLRGFFEKLKTRTKLILIYLFIYLLTYLVPTNYKLTSTCGLLILYKHVFVVVFQYLRCHYNMKPHHTSLGAKEKLKRDPTKKAINIFHILCGEGKDCILFSNFNEVTE